mgnify:CR=1 FL=1
MAWSEKEKQPFNVDESASDLEWDTKSWKVQGAINLQLGQNFEGRGWEKNLDWDTDAILNDLKENHVKIEDTEMMWYKWKKVHIELPSYRNFEWFNSDYFVSDGLVKKGDLDRPICDEFVTKSCSMSDISKLLQAMNRYMAEHGVDNDWDMDYEKELWEGNRPTCNAWEYLKSIIWLKDWFWLKDGNVAWKIGSRAKLASYGDYFGFSRSDVDGNIAHLLLKLSD